MKSLHHMNIPYPKSTTSYTVFVCPLPSFLKEVSFKKYMPPPFLP
jgi:hypothetical protein